MTRLSNYELVGGIESFGGSGNYGWELKADMGRPLTDNERFDVSRAVEKAFKEVLANTIAADPKAQERAAEEKKKLLELFGTLPIFVEDFPNGYCNDYCCKHLPWFRVYTKYGAIEIGWRKRVINIDWSKSIIKVDGLVLFEDQGSITHGTDYIHCYGYEAAHKILERLFAAAENS